MSLNDMLPAETIKTRDAAEAIFSIFRVVGVPPEDIDGWVQEIEGQWPDLAAMLFTVSKDQ